MNNNQEKKDSDITGSLIEKIEKLPPMPANIIKLRRASADPDVNYSAITPLLKDDPSICADLLRIANSARYGVGHKVETVEEAVRYFGIPSLVEFVAAACTEKIIKESFSNIRNLNEYLIHSQKTSLAAGYICRIMHQVSQHDREVYSITGLLHDIGRLIILLVADKSRYSSELLGIPWEELQQMTHDEKELYGLNHSELGMRICSRWLFPDKIIEGVLTHHRPITGNSISIPGMVVFLAEIISIQNLPDEVVKKALPPGVIEKIGLTNEKLLQAKNEFTNDHGSSH